jgi:hypothetical protein
MWKDGELDGDAWTKAAKSAIDAVTGGHGTVDGVVALSSAVANCVNNHGTLGCGRAAGSWVARTTSNGYRSTKQCFADRRIRCIGHTASVVGEKLHSIGQGLVTQARNVASTVSQGLHSAASSVYGGARNCRSNFQSCFREQNHSVRTGISNMGAALFNPVKQCWMRGASCFTNPANSVKRRYSEWRARGVSNQLAKAQEQGDTSRAQYLARKITTLKD